MRRRPGSRSRRRERRSQAIPARFAGYGAYRTCKAQADALERFCAGRLPGLRATYWEWFFTKPCGAERVEQIDWDGARTGKTQFFGCRYDGFLVVPDSGEYEIALASTQAAKLSLDARAGHRSWQGDTT